MDQLLKMALMKKCVSTISSNLFKGAAFFLFMGHLEGANINWLGGVNNDLSNDLNWSPATVPSTTDTAVFSSIARTTSLTNIGSIDFGTFLFTDNTPFMFTLDNGMVFDMQGILNLGTVPQTFIVPAGFELDFNNQTSAANSIFNVFGIFAFQDDSTAANATIFVDGPDSYFAFFNSATGGNAALYMTNSATTNVLPTNVSSITLGSLSIDSSSTISLFSQVQLQVGGNN